jgi:hypothetical protein
VNEQQNLDAQESVYHAVNTTKGTAPFLPNSNLDLQNSSPHPMSKIIGRQHFTSFAGKSRQQRRFGFFLLSLAAGSPRRTLKKPAT